MISRADDPAIQFCPIADWQFEEFVVPPEQICLAFTAAANNNIDPFCASDLSEGRKFADRGFEISFFAFCHFIVKGWIRGSENVLPGAELSQD